MSAAPTTVKLKDRSGARRAWLGGAAGLLALLVLWEVYKFLGPSDGVMVFDTRILPRTSDLAMPHTWDMVTRMFEGETGAPNADPLWVAVVTAAAFSLGIAAAGWVVGVVVGFGLALIMLRWRLAEWGLLPWIVLSQTVPIIAFAPVVRNWGIQLDPPFFEWRDWMSVALIASWLAFFPIAVGVLKGLQSPETSHTELMRTYAVGWWTMLLRLRLPAAVPFLLAAMRLAAANAVIGAVVAEVSTGLRGGIGRLLIQWAGQASNDPAKAWGPVFGAVALGLVAAGSVALLGLTLRTYRRQEESS
ncbi:ABC transporter permease subunit [Nesterenkonia salmonea]|uniref:ABC transporter permease subunit n=1 Tax=Nesterenkonia salmonea TaxID=1804987 RepID=A0A5R9BLX4_9MICC|nr:ABC transporter permease subunit [Nesterenkonia salmonea]TLQ01092.1 ABC transporter permease subunit [Nesterenkonia salmonea]